MRIALLLLLLQVMCMVWCDGDGLRFAARPVLVVRMFLQMVGAQSLCLVDKRSLLCLSQQLPLDAESLRNLRVVHLGVVVRHATSLST